MTSLKAYFDTIYQAIGEFFTRSEILGFGYYNATSNIGNWTADKSNYYNQTQSNATYLKKEGDTITGNLNMSSKNVTSVDCIVFTSGGKICSAS